MYNKTVKDIQGSNIKVKIHYAVIAYLLMLVSLLHIAIPLTECNIEKKDDNLDKLFKSIIYGGSVGLSIYGIYNLTIISIFTNYPLKVAVIDSIWGTFLYSLITYLYLVIN
tara:strand:- start:3560 stop:3892 length:333 start_codon:yes stop_codon:yes gene_type:complete